MSYQPPSMRRPIKCRRDNTPLFLAIGTLMALPALAFAVWKFVIDKPAGSTGDTYADSGASPAPATPTPTPQSNGPQSNAPQSNGPQSNGPESPVPSSSSDRVPITVPDNLPSVTAMANSFQPPSGAFKPGTIYDGSPSSGMSSMSSFSGFSGFSGGGYSSANVAASVTKALDKVKSPLALKKKSVVLWLFDSTMSCDTRRSEVASALESAYPSLLGEATPAAASTASGDAAPLLTVVARFGDDVEYLTPAPTDNQESILSALRTVKAPGTGKIENTFSAIDKAVQKFAEYGGPPHLREITVVVVTDEVGNDQDKRDATVATVKKARAPVYVIGQSATFGSVGNQQAGEGKDYFQGPETRELEQPPLEGAFGGGIIGQECGIGPYSLVHLCRESFGEYYASSSSGMTLGPQYFPRYMSEKEYQSLRGGNKALVALIAAAQMPPAQPFNPGSSVFTLDESGAPDVAAITRVQQPVAQALPPIENLFNKLKEGEADRDKLTEPRQKAAYDLAMGRASAMYVRAKGYNVLLAAFKAGGRKSEKNPDTRTWVLQQGEGIEKDSILTNTAKKAREYLERVQKEHPNSPWATAAAQELSTPIGWVWSEG